VSILQRIFEIEREIYRAQFGHDNLLFYLHSACMAELRAEVEITASCFKPGAVPPIVVSTKLETPGGLAEVRESHVAGQSGRILVLWQRHGSEQWRYRDDIDLPIEIGRVDKVDHRASSRPFLRLMTHMVPLPTLQPEALRVDMSNDAFAAAIRFHRTGEEPVPVVMKETNLFDSPWFPLDLLRHSSRADLLHSSRADLVDLDAVVTDIAYALQIEYSYKMAPQLRGILRQLVGIDPPIDLW